MHSFIKTFHSAISCNKQGEALEIIKLNTVNKLVRSGKIVFLKKNYSRIINFCLESKFDETGKSIHNAVFCDTKNNITHDENWIRKCCPSGHTIRNNECHCDDSSWDQLAIHKENTFVLNSLKQNKKINLIQCQGHLVTNSVIPVSKAFSRVHSINGNDYCIDEQFGEVEDASAPQQYDPRIVTPIINIQCETTWQTVKRVIIPAGLFLSCICLCVILLCHLFVGKLRDLHGLCLASYVASLLVADFTNFLIWMYAANLSTKACITVGYLLQFGFLATFFWLNVMCYDIWRYVRLPSPRLPLFKTSMKRKNRDQMETEVTFLYFRNYPYNISSAKFSEFPDISENNHCYKVRIWLTFVHSLMLNLAIARTSMIICTAIKLYTAGTQNCHCFFLNQSDNMPTVVNYNKNHIAEFWQRFTLFSLMVFCWATEVIAWKVKPEEIWALTDILNALQGIFIFITFIRSSKKRSTVYNHFLEVHKACTVSVIKVKLKRAKHEMKRIFFRVVCCKNIPYTSQWYGDPVGSDSVSCKTESTAIESIRDSNIRYHNDHIDSKNKNWNTTVWTMPSWKSPWSNSYFPNIISHGNEANKENLSYTYTNECFSTDTE
ncbi:unnamed protein product, partial [Meganyctiphanes norvegica]